MHQAKTKSKQSPLKKQRMIWIAVAVGIVVVILITLFYLLQPKPSVAAYCTVYKEEKARLAGMPGNTYASAVFNDQLSDANEYVQSFGKLEQVAPSDIRPDVKNLLGIYQTIAKDPSQALVAGVSGISADHNVKNWTDSHCK